MRWPPIRRDHPSGWRAAGPGLWQGNSDRFGLNVLASWAPRRWRDDRRVAGIMYLFGEFVGLGAVAARGIGTQDLELGGEERQLLQGTRHGRIVRMPLALRVEHGGEEAAIELIALELRHIHAIGGKAAHGLVERGRHVPHPE